jgi:hypothetical protein
VECGNFCHATLFLVATSMRTKMLDDDEKIESLALDRTTEQRGQQRPSGGDIVDQACVSRVGVKTIVY